ncbi:MAG: hypothetical protein AAF456_25945, partial [Planctomycetota bacterium]
QIMCKKVGLDEVAARESSQIGFPSEPTQSRGSPEGRQRRDVGCRGFLTGAYGINPNAVRDVENSTK